MPKAAIGLIGLAVMGENLALNIARNGFPIAVYNRTGGVTEKYLATGAKDFPVTGAFTIEEFVNSLERPRRIIIMVKAGTAVDSVLTQIRPLLSAGDIIMDCGNSYFVDTERRSREFDGSGIHFFGVGVSGGEEGALKGPSIMPGGPVEAYDQISPILTKIAAQVSDGACVSYLGSGAAGHYVKMVHNGIEYGDMQLIAEAYAILTAALGLTAPQLSDIFAEWNKSELDSYLIEITAHVLSVMDDDTGKPMVDVILDRAGQKGTGRWTAQDALELGIPIPTIEAAIWSRSISSFKEQRMLASKLLKGPASKPRTGGADADRLIESVRQGLYASKIASYAQGMALLKAASDERKYQLNMPEIARIWKGGCIIRAKLLNEIQAAFTRDPNLTNLLIDEDFRVAIETRQDGWRHAVRTAHELGVPVPATSASLNYYDSYRTARISANIIQAQRDYFGAHTYERIDKPGIFHTEWLEKLGKH